MEERLLKILLDEKELDPPDDAMIQMDEDLRYVSRSTAMG
jgi:hypothetical protein